MRIDMNLTVKTAVQNFKRSVGALLVVLTLVSTGVHAAQTVDPRLAVAGASIANSTRAIPAGTQFTFYGVYSDDSVVTGTNTTGAESGLGLKVKYNGLHLTNVNVTEQFMKCRIAAAQYPASNVPPTPPTAADQVVMGWIDTAIRPLGAVATADGSVGWPDLIDQASTGQCLNPGGINTGDTAAVAPTGLKLFKFTATMAPGCTSAACTSTVTFDSEGNYSYAGATAGMAVKTFTVTGAPVPNIALTSVVSRKAHGPAGGPFVDYDLPLPNFAGSIGAGVGGIDVETRAIGTQGHKIVFNFNAPVTSVGTPTLASGTGLVSISGASAVAAISGNSVVVTLSAVPDFQRVQVGLPGVNGALSVTANIALLVGDVVQSLQTTITDVNNLKSAVASSTAVGPTTFKLDINTDGNISVTDINAVKSRVANNPPGSL